MADDHFTLDIQPDVLRGVETRLGTLADHLKTKGTTVAGTPGEIGSQWTGTAADTIKTEMTGLGELMKGFSTKVEAISGSRRQPGEGLRGRPRASCPASTSATSRPRPTTTRR